MATIAKARAATLLRIKKAYADPKLDVRKAARIYFRASKSSKPTFEDAQQARKEGLEERHKAGGVRIPSGIVPSQLPVNWNKLVPPLFDLNLKKSWTAARKQEKDQCAPKSKSKEEPATSRVGNGGRSRVSRAKATTTKTSSAKPGTKKG